ncbi:MAG: rhodanese-like domain-containing protein [Eubacteriales bacterium]|nr:rhodanese-like domain-containing protein [Eubacteriales bacterium]
MFPMETISGKMIDYYVGRKDVIIIDLRDKNEYDKSHIRGALNFPYGETGWKREYPKDKILILYCDRGGASLMAARELARRGFRTRSLVGGFEAYRGRNIVSTSS